MAKALDRRPRELGEFAPRIETMQIPKDKIRDVIGTGGKVIREIVAEDRRQGRHRRRRHVIKIARPTFPRSRRPAAGSRASSRSPRSARSTPARSSTSSISARS
jgi:hypothetical protein